MSALLGLQCHLCKTQFPAEAVYVCDRCLGPLEPIYDYTAIHLTRGQIEKRPKNLWRYRELLPITGEPRTGFNSGFTPLVRCTRLADRLGVSEQTPGVILMAIWGDGKEGVAIGECAPQRATLTGSAPAGLIHIQSPRIADPREQILIGLCQSV